MKTNYIKKVALVLTFNFLLLTLFGQTPNAIKYQTVVRNASGVVLNTQAVDFKISILETSASGSAVYVETFSKTTNQFGLVNLEIGKGTVVSGVFATIDWANNLHFVKTEVDINDGNGMQNMGISQLLSVPYALNAKSAENVFSGNYTDLTNQPAIPTQTSDLINNSGFIISPNDADSDTTNEIQGLDLTGNTLTITNNSSATNIDLSSYTNLWQESSNDIYYNGGNVGVGVNNPEGKLIVKADAGMHMDTAIFEVKNKNGKTIFAVYEEGVRVYVDDSGVKSNSSKAGFAVGGFNATKALTNEYFRVTPDSIRAYIESNSGSSKAGFAVGGFNATKTTSDILFNIGASDSTDVIDSVARIAWYPQKEAFMAGRVIVQSTDSVGRNSFATGNLSKALGDYSQALGNTARAKGNNSTAIGYFANAIGHNSYAFGNAAQTNSVNSYAMGNSAIANGSSSFAIGTGSQSDGDYSVAMGFHTVSDNIYSTSMGYMSAANDTAATAMGYNCIANTPFSFAGGYLSKTNISSGTQLAEGRGAVALGYDCEAKGNGAIAMGYKCKANYPYSSAIGGFNCEANSIGATALGDGCKAFAKHSFSSGFHSKTYGNYSIASGADLVSNSYAVAIFGRFNDTLANSSRTGWVGNDPLFVIGNGTHDTLRNNAFMILKNGDMILSKDTFKGEFFRIRTSASEYDIDFSEHKLFFSSFVNNVQRKIMIIDTSGYIGIGTSNPNYPLHVKGSVNKAFSYGYLNSLGNTGTSTNGGAISIYAEHRIRAEEFNADSDIRIKNVKGVSDSKKDIELLKKVKITNYQYIDTIGKGTKEYKKVIAQELQKVFPNAVTTTTGYIPSVYSKAVSVDYDINTSTLNIETVKAHNLILGDKVRLINSNGVFETEVTSVISENIFTVTSEEEFKELFVFGKKVNDFLTVDYEAISMLNVSATQELIKKNEQLRLEIENLKKESAVMKLSLSEMDKLKADLELVKQILELKTEK